MTFDEAISASGINALLPQITELSPQGRPLLTQEASDLAIAVAKLEHVSPHLVCFSHMCEASFILYSVPQTNGHPESYFLWDVGSFQISMRWSVRSSWLGEIKTSDLPWVEVFGTVFYESDGVTPAKFNGNPVTNGRLAARILKSKGTDDATRARLYTGPNHQEKRAALWDSLSPAFVKFFSLYQN